MSETQPPRWASLGVHSFGKTYFYCLDGPSRARPPVPRGNATPARRPRSTLHEDNVWDIEDRVRKYTDCVFTNVRIPQSNDVNALRDWFLQELSSKTDDDLLIFYYHGGAGEKGNEYSWKFDGPRHVYFNAHDIFELCAESGLACMFLLDCDCPGNWARGVKLLEPKGHVSIFSRGGLLRKADGELMPDDATFTESFTDNLKAAAKDKHKYTHALYTIPQLLVPALPTWSLIRGNKLFKQNPDTPTTNIVIDPKRVRQQLANDPEAEHGRVEFLLRVTAKGKMLPPSSFPRPTAVTAVDITVPPQLATVQTPAPVAVMVGPKRPIAITPEIDEGYYDATGSEASSSLFIPEKRRRIYDGDDLTAENLLALSRAST